MKSKKFESDGGRGKRKRAMPWRDSIEYEREKELKLFHLRMRRFDALPVEEAVEKIPKLIKWAVTNYSGDTTELYMGRIAEFGPRAFPKIMEAIRAMRWYGTRNEVEYPAERVKPVNGSDFSVLYYAIETPNTNGEARYLAVFALRYMKGEETVELVRKQLKWHSSTGLVELAAETLCYMGASETIKDVIKAEAEAFRHDNPYDQPVSERIQAALKTFGEQSCQVAMEMLDDPKTNRSTKHFCIEFLRENDFYKALPVFERIVKDRKKDYQVRKHAFEVLIEREWGDSWCIATNSVEMAFIDLKILAELSKNKSSRLEWLFKTARDAPNGSALQDKCVKALIKNTWDGGIGYVLNLGKEVHEMYDESIMDMLRLDPEESIRELHRARLNWTISEEYFSQMKEKLLSGLSKKNGVVHVSEPEESVRNTIRSIAIVDGCRRISPSVCSPACSSKQIIRV